MALRVRDTYFAHVVEHPTLVISHMVHLGQSSCDTFFLVLQRGLTVTHV